MVRSNTYRLFLWSCASAIAFLISSCGENASPPPVSQEPSAVAIPRLPKKMDSLWAVYNNASFPDTFRFHALHDIARKFVYNKSDSAIVLGNKLYREALTKGESKWAGNACILLGVTFKNIGEYDSAIAVLTRGIPLLDSANHIRGIASTYTNLGSVYERLGDYRTSLDYHFRSLGTFEQLSDSDGQATANSNIGLLYFHTKDFELSLGYSQKALDYFLRTGDSADIARVSGNMGIVYEQQNEYDKALEVQLNALSILQHSENLKQKAICLSNIGVVYLRKREYDRARDYLRRACKLCDSIGLDGTNANSLGALAQVYFETGDLVKSMTLVDSVIVLSEKIEAPFVKIQALELKSKIYEKSGANDRALHAYKSFILERDNTNNAEIRNELARKEVRFLYEKKIAEDSVRNAASAKVKDAELFARNADLKRAATFQYSLYAGLAVVLAFSAFAWNRLRVTRRQKRTIENQKIMVEEKQREIVDSISYAKRLQEAILPSEKIQKQLFPGAFVLYLPKDIVAGDFYWIERTDTHRFIAAADCTGHGVPGALVSVVCSNALNRSINEFRLTDPGEILDKTRELVIETFVKSEANVMDGMDISLLAVNNSDQSLTWAGANNSLWIARDGEIIETKADKQPVGKHDYFRPFTTHEVHVKRGDIIYLFSDGFADQFGGAKGKKFKYSQLKESLLNLAALPGAKQKMELERIFGEWRGNLEQVDDVLMIGIIMQD